MMEKKRKIAILGSTGSIGRQTLDVVKRYPERFEVELISARSSVDLLASQAVEFDVNNVVICDESLYGKLSERLSGTDSKVFCGIDSLCSLVAAEDVDIVVGAMVGFSGLRPTLAAIEAGKIIALANKETLVAAGSIVMDLAARRQAPILPVDSEHSAIFQCLLGACDNPIEKIHLTASGGPFRTWSREQIASATCREALKHPNWDMGAKITIDSATMMNKGFEVIEAKWLFDVGPEKINVVVHPESVVHSMVEFADGAVIAQMGCPDMREPIALSLAFPERLEIGNRRLDFATLSGMTFEKPDMGKFPCLGLAFDALRMGGTVPCAMNAANEAAVAAFLKDRIRFYDIPEVVEAVMRGTEFAANPSLDDIFAANDEAYAKALEIIERL